MQLDFHFQMHLVYILFSLFPFINSFGNQKETIINISLVVSLTRYMMTWMNIRAHTPTFRLYVTVYICTVLTLLSVGKDGEEKHCLLNIEIVKMVYRIYTLFEELEYTSLSFVMSLVLIISLSKFGVLALLMVIQSTTKSQKLMFYVVGSFFSILLGIHLCWLYETTKIFFMRLYHTYVFPVYNEKPRLLIFQ
jgi:hypothetical protein